MIENRTPATEVDLLALLDSLEIKTHTIEHKAAFTVAEAQSIRDSLDGAHVKNLFLRDKKRNITLVTVMEERVVDLKALRGPLEAKGTLSFGSSDLLMECLGVIPGSVTPFGLINDGDGRVAMVLDKSILNHENVSIHPLRNDRTTQIASKDLLRFLDHVDHPPVILDFEALANEGSTD